MRQPLLCYIKAADVYYTYHLIPTRHSEQKSTRGNAKQTFEESFPRRRRGNKPTNDGIPTHNTSCVIAKHEVLWQSQTAFHSLLPHHTSACHCESVRNSCTDAAISKGMRHRRRVSVAYSHQSKLFFASLKKILRIMLYTPPKLFCSE